MYIGDNVLWDRMLATKASGIGVISVSAINDADDHDKRTSI
jgi:hypothetical protein